MTTTYTPLPPAPTSRFVFDEHELRMADRVLPRGAMMTFSEPVTIRSIQSDSTQVERALEDLDLIVMWDASAPAHRMRGRLSRAVHFVVDGDGPRTSLRAMLEVNAHDDFVCDWLLTAEPGAELPDGASVKCFAGHPWQTFEERLRESLTPERARDCSRPLALGRMVFSPLTLEDDDIVRAQFDRMKHGTYEDAMRAVLREIERNR